MFPNLFEATKEYWQQLDEIESRYQQGKLSIEEVDREVETLMKQLGRKRKETLLFLTESLSHWISTNTELLISLVFVLTVIYSWMLTMNH
ncbi:hypothetical protein cce_2213 [Crocosphaera subtropica ATCC 51142]|uniref:Uncharacterized protein n=1 Tax=Crocosphaera subtropica (strain ATCC 51142 / BH68) TaxID=43989 RepID=B1WPJ3_CROS5|nr:hypothetical protein [Crocosphaera subtropica]ACB51563.1 hypothetical protein cce_2213 [Crocosphaera subtropica ATCC 51142]